MRPLAPAVFELRSTGFALLALGLAGAAALGPFDDAGLRAGAAGLAGSLLVLWVLGGARLARRATRLALPVKPRWRLEATGTTVARVLLARAVPAAVLAVAAATAAAPYAEGTGAAAAGALVGAGAAALLASQRVRSAERARGRRMLHERRFVLALDRSSLYLEPAALAERREGPPPAGPWPGHRPPARDQRSAIELEPANGAATHGAGVRPRPPGRVSAAAPAPRRSSAGG